MDYEKAYKDALERAKMILCNIPEGSASVRDIGTIFPELRESEDERIREEIIDFLRSSFIKENLTDEKVAPWIAYLEKQKEQKHPNGCFTCDEYKKGYEAGRSNGFTAGYNKATKEQKPVEIHIDNPNIQKFDPDVKVTTSDSSANGKELLYVCNKSYKIGYRDGVNSVKPAEWSEEDEELREDLIKLAEYYSKTEDETEFKPHINWLKSLRPSWKPSEDEERLINTSISFLKDFADKGYENAVECIDWLKSKLNGNTCE